MPKGVYPHSRKPRVQYVALVCKVCGTTRFFPPSQRAQRGDYCSKKCAGIAARKPESQVNVTCATCSVTFARDAHRVKVNNYCSSECSYASRRVPGAKWRDPDHIRQYMKVYASEHKAQRRKYQKVTRERSREYRAARQKANNPARRLLRKNMAELLERCGGRCVYCGKLAKIEFDHFEPLARGGKNTKRNFIPCCRHCNASKSDKEPSKWILDKHGMPGLARTLLYLRSGRAFQEFCVEAAYNIEIREI